MLLRSKRSVQNGPAFESYRPLVTISVSLLCVVLFAGITIQSEGAGISPGLLRRWGRPSHIELFRSDYWGFLSSSFLHLEIWHLGFNLYWFWHFGKRIEFTSGWLSMLALVLGGAVVSELSQLATGVNSGIGLSGVVYGLFGFVLARSRFDPQYKAFLDRRTMHLFLIWLLVCVVLTQLKILNVANAAHFGGALFGAVVGLAGRLPRVLRVGAGVAFIALLTGCTLVWPRPVAWLEYKAYCLHDEQRFPEAMAAYREVLRYDATNSFALQNLKDLQIRDLEIAALKAFDDGNLAAFKAGCRQVLRLDPANEWATENLKRFSDD